MKKIISVFLLLSLILSLAGCGSADSVSTLENAQAEAEQRAREKAAKADDAPVQPEPEPEPLPDAAFLWETASGLELQSEFLDYEENTVLTETVGKVKLYDSRYQHRMETDRSSELPSMYFQHTGDTAFELFYTEGVGYYRSDSTYAKHSGADAREQADACIGSSPFKDSFLATFAEYSVREENGGYRVVSHGATASLADVLRRTYCPKATTFVIHSAEGTVLINPDGSFRSIGCTFLYSSSTAGTSTVTQLDYSRTYLSFASCSIPVLKKPALAEETEDLRIPLLLERAQHSLDSLTAAQTQEGLAFYGSLDGVSYEAGQVSRLSFDFTAEEPRWKAVISVRRACGEETETSVSGSEYRSGKLLTTENSVSTQQQEVTPAELRKLTLQNLTALCGKDAAADFFRFAFAEENGQYVLSFTASDERLLTLLGTGFATYDSALAAKLYGFTAWTGGDCVGQYEIDARTGALTRFVIDSGLQELTLSDGTAFTGETIYELTFPG